MKHLSVKRSLAILLTLAMVLSLFAGLSITASAANKLATPRNVRWCGKSSGGYLIRWDAVEHATGYKVCVIENPGGAGEYPRPLFSNKTIETNYVEIPTVGYFYSGRSYLVRVWAVADGYETSTAADTEKISYTELVNGYTTPDPVYKSVTETVKVGTQASWTVDYDRNGFEVTEAWADGGDVPPGMSFSWSETTMPTLSGKPTATGYYSSWYYARLENGQVVNCNFSITVTETSETVTSETIRMKAGEVTYTSFNYPDDSSVNTVEILDGSMPHGVNYSWGEGNPLHTTGTPDVCGTSKVVFQITLSNGKVFRHTVTFVVEASNYIDTCDSLTLEVNKDAGSYYFNDMTDNQYSDVVLVDGKLPTGMSQSYSEVDGPRIYGTPTETGTFTATFRIRPYDGSLIYYRLTVNVIEAAGVLDNFVIDLTTGAGSVATDTYSKYLFGPLYYSIVSGDLSLIDSKAYDFDGNGTGDIILTSNSKGAIFKLASTNSFGGNDFTFTLSDEALGQLSGTTSYARSITFKLGTGYDLWIGGRQVNELNRFDVMGDGIFVYTPDTKTLSVKGDYACDTTNPIYSSVDDLTIYAAADATLSSAKWTALRLDRSATLTGPGVLKLVSETNSGLYAPGRTIIVTIENANVEAKGIYGMCGYPIGEKLIVRNSNVRVEGVNAAICDFGGGITLNTCRLATNDCSISETSIINDNSGYKAKSAAIERVYPENIVNVEVSGSNPFTDVKAGDWYYEPVMWAYYHAPRITTGTSATTFAPKRVCTRSEIVTFLWRAAGEPESTITSNQFKDVKETDFFYKAVLWAVENNITKGTSATTFAPMNKCTRGEVVTFLYRAAGEPTPTITSNPFKDVKETDFFYKAVLWAVENNITKGTSATSFAPKNQCTRGEIVTFLYRAFGRIAGPVNELKTTDFLMYIEDVYTVTSRGAEVTGRVTSGKIWVGDQVAVRCFQNGQLVERIVTVEQITMFHRTMEYAEAGDNVGILLGMVDAKMFSRGNALVNVSSHLKSLNGRFTGKIECPSDLFGTLNEGNYQLFVSTYDYTAEILDLPNGSMHAGDSCEGCVIGKLYQPVVVYVGQQLSIRVGGRTYGTFTVSEIEP